MTKVGVIRGGTSNQYNESIANGSYVLRNLPRDQYEPIDIFIDIDGTWHVGGLPLNYEKLKQRVDVIWNALYGYYGADGQVQQLLENLNIPYTGAGPFVSSLAMNKKMTKDHLAKHGAQTPQGIYVENWGEDDREETVSLVVQSVSEKFSPPWIIEPISLVRSSGPIRAKNRNELFDTLLNAFDLSLPVLIEEEIFGKEISVFAVPGFRNNSSYTFLPLHKENGDYKNYFDEDDEIQKTVSNLHKKLDLGPYSSFKCVVDKRGDVSVTGIETQPAFHPGSPLHHALKELGVTFGEFANHLISEAMNKK
ncbi:MAG: hypothetical protein WCO09_01475 [bacterium]